MGAVERFSHDGLTIEVFESHASAQVIWRGVSEARDPDAVLVPFLNALADRWRVGKSKPVTVDFRPFEYMNSATVIPILQFVKRLDAAGVRTRVIYDQSVSWQRVNFRCMKTIARTLTNIEVCSEPRDPSELESP
ncbi:hypothetical protein [Pendulispora albinea]|uniref:STAS domain-containing protein n=1 Tax=Pendulispora albinea TaxID=2741071 RepID=A0ABZ2M4D8_9BACT